MDYRLEYSTNGKVVCIAVSQKTGIDTTKIFLKKGHSVGDQPNFVKQLFNVNGINGVTLMLDTIMIEKDDLFFWIDIMPRILEIIKNDFASDKILDETRPPTTIRLIPLWKYLEDGDEEPDTDLDLEEELTDVQVNSLNEKDLETYNDLHDLES
jgi:Scaffold protein Nfu/NifU N terminal